MHFSLSDYLTDAVQNSLEAGATVVTADIRQNADWVDIYIGDNGRGMDQETLARAMDPFYTDGVKHPRRKVGLGLPFFRQAAETAGGMFEISSDPEYGTSVHARFAAGHLDFPPLGDIPGTILALMLNQGDFELKFSRQTPEGQYSVSRGELLDSLGDLESGDSLSLARQYLSSLEEDL